MNAVFQRPCLFVPGRTHVRRPPAVDHGDALGPEFFGLDSSVNRRHAATDNDHMAAYRHAGVILRLAQFGDEFHRVAQSAGGRLIDADAVHAAQAHAQKHRVIVLK